MQIYIFFISDTNKFVNYCFAKKIYDVFYVPLHSDCNMAVYQNTLKHRHFHE